MPQWLEIAGRTLIAVVVLFSFTKLLGRRQVSQLSMFEYITGITIGSLAAYISLDLEAQWYLGIVSLAVWIGVSYLLEILTMKSKGIRQFIDGKPLVVIQKGNIIEKNLRKAKYSGDDLLEQLRVKNIFNASHVEFAILEPDGQLSVYPKKDYQPLTLSITGKHQAPVPPPKAIIVDGKLENKALQASGKDKVWLDKELEKRRVTMDEVYLAQVDADGAVSLDLYDDHRKG